MLPSNSTSHFWPSISGELVQTIIDSGHPSLPLVAKQGAMQIVKSSALVHRASPIKSGSRYLSVAFI
jgi:hypothetical protein